MGTNNKMGFKIMICILMFFSTQTAYSLELKNNYNSSVISQIATYTLDQIEKYVKQKDGASIEIARKIANVQEEKSVTEKLTKIRTHLLLLEKNNIDKLELSIIEPPIIFNTNVDLESTVLVIFTCNGKTLKSGMMTFKLISPMEKDNLIIYGLDLGHVCFSLNDIFKY